MAVLKDAATQQLKLLMVDFLLNCSLHLAPTTPAKPYSACGSKPYPRLVVLGQYLLSVATHAAAMVLFSVAAATLIAVATFADGLHYSTGCSVDAVGMGIGPLSVMVMVILLVVQHGHSHFAWVAVPRN